VSLFWCFYHDSNEAFSSLDEGKGCDLLAEKTHASITDETLATIFAMSQQNSKKLACQLTFKWILCVYFIGHESMG